MTQLIKHTEKIILPVAGGSCAYEMMQNTTPEQVKVIKALTSPKANSQNDAALLYFFTGWLNKALVKLQQNKPFSDGEEQTLFYVELIKLVRERYNFLTIAEIQIALDKGVAGDFKQKPDEVIFINYPQINNWLKLYRQQVKPAAMKQLREVAGTGPPPDYDAETELNGFLQKIRDGYEATDLDWISQTAQHYDRLKAEKAFKRTNEELRQIMAEERAKLMQQSRDNLDNRNPVTKLVFKAFEQSQAGADNPYEKRLYSNCRVRVFREWAELQTRNQKKAG